MLKIQGCSRLTLLPPQSEMSCAMPAWAGMATVGTQVGQFSENEQIDLRIKRYSTEQYFCREKVLISNEWRNDMNSLIESTLSWRRTWLGRSQPTTLSGAGPKPCGICSDREAWGVWANPAANPSSQGLPRAGEEQSIWNCSSGSCQPGGRAVLVWASISEQTVTSFSCPKRASSHTKFPSLSLVVVLVYKSYNEKAINIQS